MRRELGLAAALIATVALSCAKQRGDADNAAETTPATAVEPAPGAQGQAAAEPAPAPQPAPAPAAENVVDPATGTPLPMVAGHDVVLPWVDRDVDGALRVAAAHGKGVMLDIAAEWCAPCVELEQTFADPRVREAILAGYIPVKIDVTEQSDADAAVQDRFGATRLPAVLFLDASGAEKARVNEFLAPEAFLAAMPGAG